MRVVQTPRDLYRDVEDAGECLVVTARVQAAVADPVTQAAALDIFGEYPRHATERPHVVAAAHMRVQSEGNPRFRFTGEPFAVGVVAEQLGTRALDREVGVPGEMPDAVDDTHPAFPVHVGDL